MLLKFFVTMLAIMNPLGGVAIFISLTDSYTDKEKRTEALMTGLAVFIILLVVTWLGAFILDLFGISIASFRIAGGLIILLMGLHMLQSKPSPFHHTKEEHEAAKKRESIATIPMAIPLIAGPGAISTIIVYVHESQGVMGIVLTSIIDLMLALIVTILLFFSGWIGRRLGDDGTKIVTRIMGLILAAMAMDMILAGMRTALPALA